MILLTSLSSRRRELLQQIGFTPVTPLQQRDFPWGFRTTDFYQVDSPVLFNYHQKRQTLTLDEVKEMTVEVARQKIQNAVVHGRALTIYNIQPEKTVAVGADTIIFLNGRVLDRPSLVNPDYLTPDQLQQAKKEARLMLSDLKGKTFYAITGLVVARADDLQIELSCCVATEVKMKKYSDQDIERYIDTKEPLDKAGAFGIQEQGVALIETIMGSYSNVVGLPLVELVDLLKDPRFEGLTQLPLSGNAEASTEIDTPGLPELTMVAIGDISYDLRFSELPAGFFSNLAPPGRHLQGNLEGTVGGTAVIFAQRAREAGFKQCTVLGSIGGDALGKLVEDDLVHKGIRTLLPVHRGQHTSITIVLRDQAAKDTLLTISHTQQRLTESEVSNVRPDIEKAHVVFVSGYCLTDPDRRQATLKIMKWAKEANEVVVLDATVDMDKAFDFTIFKEMISGKVDVLVVEVQTILGWLKEKDRQEQDWKFINERVVPILRQFVPIIFLRTSTYSHELIITPKQISPPIELDYMQRQAEEKLGYADEKTAQHLYNFMSPRLLLASSSSRRIDLLRQVVSDTKFKVLASDQDEPYSANETPKDRVTRLALEKARVVLSRKSSEKSTFSPSIEVVIGADTEIALDGVALGKPEDENTAREILRKLSGRSHEVVTGIALIDTRTGQEVSDCITTQVHFKDLSQEEIEYYISSGEPIGKAGAYGIQGLGALFVMKIVGSYSNVMGLPLERLSEILDQDFHMPIWDIDKVSCWRF